MSEHQQELNAAERLWRIRHSASHILAQAVLEVFPDAKLAIGPPIANGFYYDFDLPRSLTDDDLADLEERMSRIVKLNAELTTWTTPISVRVHTCRAPANAKPLDSKRWRARIGAGTPNDPCFSVFTARHGRTKQSLITT